MRYRITVGNDYVRSRELTVYELDATLQNLRDVFGDRLSVMLIDAEPESSE